MWNRLKEFLNTPTPAPPPLPWKRVPCAKGIHVPSPWIAEDFPELAGPELPPPLDYFHYAPDFSNPFNVAWSRFTRRKKRNFRIGISLLAAISLGLIITSALLPKGNPQVTKAFTGALGLTLLVVCLLPGVLIQVISSPKRFSNLPGTLLIRRRSNSEEIALLPLTARDLVLGTVVRAMFHSPISPGLSAILSAICLASFPAAALGVAMVLGLPALAWITLGILTSISIVATRQWETGLSFLMQWRLCQFALRVRLVELFRAQVSLFKFSSMNEMAGSDFFRLFGSCLWFLLRTGACLFLLVGQGVWLFHHPAWSLVILLECLALYGLLRSPVTGWIQKYRRWRTRSLVREVERLYRIEQEFLRGTYDGLRDPIPLLRGEVPPIPTGGRASFPKPSHAG